MKNSTSHIRHSSAKFSKALPVPTDAAPTKEILIQSQKNAHTKNITNAIPFAKLGIKISPKDVNEKNRHLFTEMEAMKNEINMLTKMIASTAVIDKNQRPSEGHGSLIELKKELITVFRKAAEWSTGDDFYGDEITKAVSNLQATLENISPEAASKKHSYMKH